jgi:hypothetical protein
MRHPHTPPHLQSLNEEKEKGQKEAKLEVGFAGSGKRFWSVKKGMDQLTVFGLSTTMRMPI